MLLIVFLFDSLKNDPSQLKTCITGTKKYKLKQNNWGKNILTKISQPYKEM